MRRMLMGSLVALVLALAIPVAAPAQVAELQGSWVIDGYRFDPGDRSPRGTIAYDRDANAFRGTYVGLKLPADRPELHAWLYDTRSKQAQHLGRIAYKPQTVGKNKAAFDVSLPAAPSGSKILPALKPAFYLYAALPGANLAHTCFD